MEVYIRVDFHTRTQTVCSCDSEDGEIDQRTLNHKQNNVRGFYTQFATPTAIRTGEEIEANCSHHSH